MSAYIKLKYISNDLLPVNFANYTVVFYQYILLAKPIKWHYYIHLTSNI